MGNPRPVLTVNCAASYVFSFRLDYPPHVCYILQHVIAYASSAMVVTAIRIVKEVCSSSVRMFRP